MSTWNPHNKDNKPQEHFVRLLNEYYQSVVFGGRWVATAHSGSRCSYWSGVPSNLYSYISARGVCDHIGVVK